MDNCCFCNEFQHYEVNEEIKRRYSVTNRVLFDNDKFVVLPTVSPLVKGHLLVLPKRHINTMKQLEDDEKKQLFTLTKNIMQLISENYFIFEHGAFPSNGNTCGVDHAHIHILPLKREVSNIVIENISNNYASKLYIDFISSLNDEKDMPYLSYGNDIQKMYVCNNAIFPSQFMRKLLCNYLGTKKWNWRGLTNKRYFRTTVSELKGRIHGVNQ